MKAIGYQTIFREDYNCEAIYIHFNYMYLVKERVFWG